MKKTELSAQDHDLIAAAIETVKKPVLQLSGERMPALVGAALRLEGGQIITAVNFIADVGSLSLCAEPIAIAEAARQHHDKKIEAVVAVYHAPGQAPCIIPPCGRCREFISDYAPEGFVILREPKSAALFKVTPAALLPFRYADYWHQGALV